MNPHSYPGRSILFEGPNGAGKSTQVKRAHDWVRARSKAVLTKEPYTRTPEGRPVHLGDEIYQVLKGEHRRTRLADVTPEQFQRYFYFPNRLHHYLDIVIPAMEEGGIVLSDRGLASVSFGAANFGVLHQLMAEQLAMFNALQLPWPDAIIIYDVSAEVAMQRLRSSGKELDGHENLRMQELVARNYRHFAQNWPNCHLVDASGSADEVFELTVPILDRVLRSEVYAAMADHNVIE